MSKKGITFEIGDSIKVINPDLKDYYGINGVVDEVKGEYIMAHSIYFLNNRYYGAFLKSDLEKLNEKTDDAETKMVPLVHAHRIIKLREDGTYEYGCTNCGGSTETGLKYSFCPWCGAIFDLKEIIIDERLGK